MYPRLFAALAFAAIVSGGTGAHATPNEVYSAYEQQTLDDALADLGAELDPEPEGKRIAGVDIRVLEVIEERDPLPNFLNWFHARSKDYVIERELLLKKGERYKQQVASESARNLRSLRQLSLVIVAPIKADDPDEVRILVIAKDVWSLRLNSNYRIRAGQLEYLLLQPSEENLAGTHRRVSGQLIYEPDTISFGSRYVEPFIAGSRISAAVDSNLIINHATGEVEGSFGSVQYGVPLYWTWQKWAWGAVAAWRHETTRRFIGTELRTFNAEATPEDDAIPFVYDSEVISGSVSATRSYGRQIKSDISFGAEATRSVYRPPDLSGFDPDAVREFTETAVPVSQTTIGPFVRYHFYLNRFTSLLQVETLGLQENFLIGPEAYLRLYPVAKVLGSSRNFFGYHGAIAYTHRLGNGLGRVYAAGTAEMKPNGSEIFDSLFQGGVRFVSPSFPLGRVVYDGTVLMRPHNFSNTLIQLGGDGRLRGYPSGLYIGENLFASNVEFRSRSIQLWTFQVGGAVFWDMGDAFDDFEAFRPKHGLGVGIRAVFPQLQRAVARVDWGFTATRDRCIRGDGTVVSGCTEPSPFDGLLLTFEQAFGLPRPTGTVVELAP